MEEIEDPAATQLDEVEKVFHKFDADGDRKISPAELGAVLNSLGAAASSEEVELLVSEMDADRDGYIDLDEFRSFQRRGDGDEKELKEAFDLYDKDGNGMISAGELHSVLCRLGEKCSVEDCQRMIAAFDVDGDGFVNFEEFNKMMTGKTCS